MLPPCCIGSQFPQHLVHLVGIDGGVIPTHAVASLDEVAADLPVSHAPHELIPRGFDACLSVEDARLSGVVEEFIVADPEGGIPGFVVCPSVHAVAPFVCCVNCRPCSAAVAIPCVSSPSVTLCPSAVVVFGSEVIIEIAIVCHGAAAEILIVEGLRHGEVGWFQIGSFRLLFLL